MLKYNLLHPEILEALGGAGHGSKILIADGNYPFGTRAHPAARRVYLNLAPGLVNAVDVLRVLVDAIPIEAADIMLTAEGTEAPIIAEFRALLPKDVPVRGHERFAFYDLCRDPDTALVIATGEQRIYANILLTIGVVKP
ncbi:MAG: transporter [Candidatus Roseilinea sp.]|nr:MAG: transporter [Candidatus Roseilinea sp.]